MKQNGDFLLVEVISANINENGTISTAVEVDKLQSLPKRTKRSTESDQRSVDVGIFNPGQIKHTVMGLLLYIQSFLRGTLSY